ncbi:MAG: hypothetical protein LUC22_00920 [Prevotella sp.]|nr:hypothetical protein [Prevotella sp.]
MGLCLGRPLRGLINARLISGAWSAGEAYSGVHSSGARGTGEAELDELFLDVGDVVMRLAPRFSVGAETWGEHNVEDVR